MVLASAILNNYMGICKRVAMKGLAYWSFLKGLKFIEAPRRVIPAVARAMGITSAKFFGLVASVRRVDSVVG